MSKHMSWQDIILTAAKIREFELVVKRLYHLDYIQSPVHLSVGQELLSVLIAKNTRSVDRVVGNYRSHAIAIALAQDLEPIVLELLAKKGGVSGGKAGSMHLSVPERGLMWTSAIVGSGVPISCGIADALKRETVDGVCIVMIGDGALEEGCVIESLNVAAVLSLPVVFALEDNGLAIHTKKSRRSSVQDYLDLARTYGINCWDTSYKEPEALKERLDLAVAHSRKTRRPSFIRVECYRWLEHVGVGDDWDLGYRDKDELIIWEECDIVENPERFGITSLLVNKHRKEYHEQILEIFRQSLQAEDPSEEDLLFGVY